MLHFIAAMAASAGVCVTSGGCARWCPVETFVEPSPFNAIQGLAIDHRGRLLAASLLGGQIWLVDRETGTATVRVDRPDGQSDDLAIGPNGEMAWTSKLEGKIRFRKTDTGEIKVLASLPSINSIGFDPRNGRLYAAQAFGADALWEIDRSGAGAPRLIAHDLGGLNSFGVGPDGMIYGPLQDKGMVARIDPDSGDMTVLARGFALPGPFSVKMSSDGNLWVGNHGQLIRLDRQTGQKTVVARFEAIADDLTISPEGEIYISDGSRNAIHVFSPATGAIRNLIPPRMAIPAGLAISDGRLWVAGAFALRSIDLKSKTVREEFHEMKVPFPFTVSLMRQRLAVSSIFLNVIEIFDTGRWRSIAKISGLSVPSDVVLLDDGSLIYSEYATGHIVRASGANYAERTQIASGLNRPVQMAVTRDRIIYITEETGTIKEILLDNPGENRSVMTGLDQPEGLDVTPWGTLIVAEVGQRRLVELDPSSGQMSVIAQDLPIGLAIPSPLPEYALPTGVAVDQDGTVYMSADKNNAIYTIRRCQ